jgi:hypothetical protein
MFWELLETCCAGDYDIRLPPSRERGNSPRLIAASIEFPNFETPISTGFFGRFGLKTPVFIRV